MNVCANRHASLLRFDIKGWTSFAYSRGISFKSFPRYHHHPFFFCFFSSVRRLLLCDPSSLFSLFFFCFLYLRSFRFVTTKMLFVLFIKISTIQSSNSIDYHVFSRIEQTVQLTALRHLFSSLVRLESWRGIVSKRFFSRQRERDIIVIFYGNSIDRAIFPPLFETN